MLKRIKLLMLLQMSDKFKIKKIDNYKKLFGRIGLFSLGFIIVTALCALLLFLIHSVVFIVTPKIIIFCLVFLQFLSIPFFCNSEVDIFLNFLENRVGKDLFKTFLCVVVMVDISANHYLSLLNTMIDNGKILISLSFLNSFEFGKS